MCWIVCLQLICELMCWPMDHGSSLLRQSRCAALQGSAISSIETSRGIAMSRNLYVNIFFKFDRLPQDRKMPKLMSLWLRRRRKRWKIRRDKSVHCFFLSHCSISFTCVCVCDVRVWTDLKSASAVWTEQSSIESVKISRRAKKEAGKKIRWRHRRHRRFVALLPCHFSALRNSFALWFSLLRLLIVYGQ